MDPTDRFCRNCGAPLAPAPRTGLFNYPVPSPEQAAGYWRNFFRPFFTMAFIFFGAFFLFAMLLLVAWFFMFRS